MQQNNTLVGFASIDMLVSQLHRNEFGRPKFSKASLIQSTWVDGPTVIRQKPLPATKRKLSKSRA